MKTVIISAARTLFALRLARAFSSQGVRVVTTDTVHYATAAVSIASSHYVRTASPRLNYAQYLRDVARLLEEEKPDLWIPAYEEVFYLARARETHLPELPLFAPPYRLLSRFHCKQGLVTFAGKLGFAPRETLRLMSDDDVRLVAARSRELVFKRTCSRGGDNVLVCPAREELAAIHPTPQHAWIAQSYLPGEEISTYSIASHGRLMAHAAYRPRHRDGLGAAIAFDQVEGGESEAIVRGFIEATGWHGQIGFDMRRDETGKLCAIDCNPRATSGIHFLGLPHLIAAFAGQEAKTDKVDRFPIISLAMLTYGAAAARGTGRLPHVWKDCFRGKDVIWDKKDTAPYFQQVPFLFEVLQLSHRHKISMHNAFTYDLEWDGDDLP